MRGSAESPRLLPLLLVLCAAIRHAAESSAGSFRHVGGTGQTTAMLRAWPVEDDPRSSSGSRCAAVCGTAAAGWGRRSDGWDGDEQEDEKECGVTVELGGFEENLTVVSLELDVGLAAGSADSLRVFTLDESFDIEYDVNPQRRR